MSAPILYKERQFSEVKLGKPGAEKTYKIPNEFTVEEWERIYELAQQFKRVKDEQVAPEGTPEREKQLQEFWGSAWAQLEVMFQHYQPEMTADELKTIITWKEALGILDFYTEYRYRPKNLGEEGGQTKKKSLK